MHDIILKLWLQIRAMEASKAVRRLLVLSAALSLVQAGVLAGGWAPYWAVLVATLTVGAEVAGADAVWQMFDRWQEALWRFCSKPRALMTIASTALDKESLEVFKDAVTHSKRKRRQLASKSRLSALRGLWISVAILWTFSRLVLDRVGRVIVKVLPILKVVVEAWKLISG